MKQMDEHDRTGTKPEEEALAALRRAHAAEIDRLTNYDALTGLKNYHCFKQDLQRTLDAGGQGRLLFLDLDDFKVVNDGYGHDYGDALLVDVAAYLREQFPEGALYRFGGDEFALLLDGAGAQEAQRALDALMERTIHPWQVLERTFYCTLSIGVVSYPEEGDTVRDVVRHADLALYQAKNLGKDNFALFTPGLADESRKRAEMESRMRRAIERDFEGFEVYYQPIQCPDGRILGAEALLRWRDEAGNLLPPGQFIPLAEYLGLIMPLGGFVLRSAAEECARINKTQPDFSMNINVSVRQFQCTDFESGLLETLEATGVDLRNIILEITEGLAIQSLSQLRRVGQSLQRKGLQLAMDDFGTGYSSLANLKKMPLDIIKIDRSFVQDSDFDQYARSFVRLITDLAHASGRKVTAEGVETERQLALCAEFGADRIQGFYFHKPMPAPALHEVLRQNVAQLP